MGPDMRLMAILAIMTATMTSPSSQECLTVTGKSCVFPFSYQGYTYGACTKAGSVNGAAWCATRVDRSGKVVRGRWEDCDLACSNQGNGNSGFDKCPANGRYPNTNVFCLNEDGSTNCRKDSDCPDETDVCGQPKQSIPKCDNEIKISQANVCGKVNPTQYDCDITKCECSNEYNGVSKTASSCYQCNGFDKCECYTERQGFVAEVLKVTTATSGQSFSGSQGLGVISNRCPATRPCPYRDNKCGRLVGLGRGGRRAACPRRRF